jgi:magnesium-transporting ATPase (P-type)
LFSGAECKDAAKLPAFATLAKIAAVCNESRIVYLKETDKYDRIGEPTEAALKTLAEKIGTPEGKSPANKEEVNNFSTFFFFFFC